MRGLCSAEAKAACPFQKCVGSDVHHSYFPAHDYTSKVEKTFRELPVNKRQLPRCLHRAIHASGYIPEKPSRNEMLAEIWPDGTFPETALIERDIQTFIGNLMMGRDFELPPDGETA